MSTPENAKIGDSGDSDNRKQDPDAGTPTNDGALPATPPSAGADAHDGHDSDHAPAGELAARFPDPGLPAHVHRRADTDPKAARRAERQVSGLFLLSIAGTLVFAISYFAIRLTDFASVNLSTQLLGGGMALALFSIGAAMVHWAKTLMPDEEISEERHAIASTRADQQAAAKVLAQGADDVGLPRRRMIWGTMAGAMAAAPIMAVLPLWGLWSRGKKDTPAGALSRTVWTGGMRLVRDPTGEPVKAEDVPIGGVVHVLPEVVDANGKRLPGIPAEAVNEHGKLSLNEMGKAAVLVIRLEPDQVVDRPDRKGWSYNGIVAYSKICTHVGCPVALYEQTTHHLLCPCHQSTFDVRDSCKVIFGPANRSLPQLAITVDQEGYLVSQQGFTEPVGPSFWERG